MNAPRDTNHAMHASHTTHVARVLGPITFVGTNGRERVIPIGPCLVEELDGDMVDIVWGPAGEKSAVLPSTEAEAAERAGNLMLLD